MNTVSRIRETLHRMQNYLDTCEDKDLIERLLGVRAAVFAILEDKWRRTAPHRTTPNGFAFTRCRNCQGTGIVPPQEWIRLSKELNSNRPSPNVLIDQCPVTSIDLARRVAMMHDLGDIRDKSILCVGDNDFASLLISIVSKPREIVVVENDDRVIEFISSQASTAQLPISVTKLDIRTIRDAGCPEDLKDRFDVFETDPPYTEVGMKFYAYLGMRSLKRHGSGYLVVPHMKLERWSDELMYSVQSFLAKGGFVLTDLVPRSQTFQHQFRVISSIVRSARVQYTHLTTDLLTGLDLDRFYTIH